MPKHSATEWRLLAERSRFLAETVQGVETRRTMLDVAAFYERQAERAEAAQGDGVEEQE